MSKVMYKYLFVYEPLFPTYMQLQMVDQSIQFSEGIAKDIMVRTQDHYVLLISWFQIWEKMYLLSWEDRSSTLPTRLSTLDQDKSTFNCQDKRYDVISIVIQLMSMQGRSIPRGDVDHPNVGTINSPRMKKQKL